MVKTDPTLYSPNILVYSALGHSFSIQVMSIKLRSKIFLIQQILLIQGGALLQLFSGDIQLALRPDFTYFAGDFSENRIKNIKNKLEVQRPFVSTGGQHRNTKKITNN